MSPGPDGTVWVDRSKRYSNIPTWTVVLPPPTVPVCVVVVRVVVVSVVVADVVGFATFTPAPNVPFIPSFA